MAIDVGGLFNVAATGYGYNEALDNIRKLRSGLEQKGSQLAQGAAEAAQFQPFTVTSGVGQIGVGPQGSVNLQAGMGDFTSALQQRAQQGAGQLGASPMFGDISEQALQQAQASLGQTTPTAESLFEQMQATRQGEQERQRLALENRLAAQGRLGTQTAAFGGTPEALALEKAIQEQQSADLLAATRLAPQLAQQQLAQTQGLFGLGQQAATATPALEQAQLGTLQSQLGTSFLPTQQLLSTFQPAAESARLAQSGRASATQALSSINPTLLQAIQKTGETEAGLQQVQIEAILRGLGLDSSAEQGNSLFDRGWDWIEDKWLGG